MENISVKKQSAPKVCVERVKALQQEIFDLRQILDKNPAASFLWKNAAGLPVEYLTSCFQGEGENIGKTGIVT